jgi:ribosomal protein L13E
VDVDVDVMLISKQTNRQTNKQASKQKKGKKGPPVILKIPREIIKETKEKVNSKCKKANKQGMGFA